MDNVWSQHWGIKVNNQWWADGSGRIFETEVQEVAAAQVALVQGGEVQKFDNLAHPISEDDPF